MVPRGTLLLLPDQFFCLANADRSQQQQQQHGTKNPNNIALLLLSAENRKSLHQRLLCFTGMETRNQRLGQRVVASSSRREWRGYASTLAMDVEMPPRSPGNKLQPIGWAL